MAPKKVVKGRFVASAEVYTPFISFLFICSASGTWPLPTPFFALAFSIRNLLSSNNRFQMGLE